MKKLICVTTITLLGSSFAFADPPIQLSAEEYDTVAAAVAEKQGTVTPAQAGTFDCDQLYDNYKDAMETHGVKKKKKFGLGKIAKIAGSGLGSSVALVSGADLGVLKTVSQAESIANTVNVVSGNQNGLNTLMEATNVLEINRTAYRLAMENGCKIKKLDKITKKYAAE